MAAQGNRGGRPLGEVRADTREAQELAEFLRHLLEKAGTSLTGLAGVVGLAPSTVSTYLSGKVPEEEFVLKVVAATTRDAHDRIRALRLLKAARDPVSRHTPARRAGAGADPDEHRSHLESLHQRLIRAEDQREDLQRTLDNTTRLVMLLLGILQALQQRVGELTVERDALLGHREEIARLLAAQEQLARAQAQERRTVGELVRTEALRSETERLLPQVLDQVVRLTEQVALLQGGAAGPAHPLPARQGPADAADPAALDIDRALTRAGEVYAQDERTVRRISGELAHPGDPLPALAPGGPGNAGPGGADGRIVTFYSYEDGIGRPEALANCAWILAANGHRVLVADLGFEAPSLERHFGRLLAPSAPEGARGVLSLLLDFRDEQARTSGRPGREWLGRSVRGAVRTVDRSGFAAGGLLDVLLVGRRERQVTELTRGTQAFADEGYFGDLREELRRQYDYVLVDGCTGLSTMADICTEQLPDDLVVCFTLSGRSIDDASRIALRIAGRQGERAVRILPVATMVDGSHEGVTEMGRALAAARFAGLPATEPVETVEIPYRPLHDDGRPLAAAAPHPGAPAGLLAAYERLTAAVTGGRVTGLPRPASPAQPHHRPVPAEPVDVHLSFVPEDRMWAEWIAHVLEAAGFRVLPRDAGPGMARPVETVVVVVLSPAYLRSDAVGEAWEWAVVEHAFGARRRLVQVRVVPVPPSERLNRFDLVDLADADEPQAAARLLSALGRQELPAPDTAGAPRFPGRRPKIWNVPPRNRHFTGRAEELGLLRERLQQGAVTVVGPAPRARDRFGGVGATQLALEYAHRFRADYDLVWWIDAGQSQEVLPRLAELAGVLGLADGAELPRAAGLALVELQYGSAGTDGRWLVVLDDAQDPGEVVHLVPGGGAGHVLVTSRDPRWARAVTPGAVAPTAAVTLDALTRATGTDHLMRRTEGALARADAEAVAAAVDDLPLAVDLAGAWLKATGTPAADYLAALREQTARLREAGGGPADPLPVVRAHWRVAAAYLRPHAASAVELMRLCAHLGPGPIAAHLVPRRLAWVLPSVVRYGLVTADAADAIRVHRMVGEAVRAEMTGEERDTARYAVHRLLVEARLAVGSAENPANWPFYETIWPHLAPSRAHESRDTDVRVLMLDRIRYLRRRGAGHQAQRIADQLG
ncbi:FxSxx-COOH system tetratricopeptide repeat protein [Kitasatospora sp. NPDC057936]|uniref:FxSxx-COOH system tetratricopeptide repeat protein n=1 Tax=Kitasatospora sp. NPDC057936 TaxID=3346283 RepID=UPI0036DDC454